MRIPEEVLRTQTFKDGTEIERRVFYTLQQEPKTQQAHRNSKAIGLLVKHLREKGLISEEQIDELLFGCV